MKGNKKILALALLLLLVAVSLGTYAIYKSSATGNATASTAAWVVKVNNSNIVTSDTFTISSSDVDWSGATNSKVEGKIAPGDTGTITILIDADGSEVDVDYAVTIGDATNTDEDENENFTVAAHTGSLLEGTIGYSSTEGEMEEEITLDVTWTQANNADANEADVDFAGDNISIPITVTVTQHIPTQQP